MTRKGFRRKVLECDGALRQVVDTLKRVHIGELPFDRTVKISLTENAKRTRSSSASPTTSKRSEHLMSQNQEEFQKARRSAKTEKKKPAARNIASAAARRCTLVEELISAPRRSSRS